MTVAEAIREAADRLSSTSDTARLDAEVLMAHALGVTRSDLLVRHMREAPPAGFGEFVERRMRHEPVAHITGHQEFYGLDFVVTPDTLIPRSDSETLIEAARTLFAGRAAPRRIADLGTGTGALLIAGLSLFPDAQGVAIDASAPALDIAKSNAERLGFSSRTNFLHRSWHDGGWEKGLGTFDLVLCNPPYVETSSQLAPSVAAFEPSTALFAGPDGLDDYRALVPKLGKLLSEDGVVILEIGAEQADPVRRIAKDHGYDVTLCRDLADRPRAVILT